MRVTYDPPPVDGAYVYLTEETLTPGRESVLLDLPEGIQGMVVMDWKEGKLVGLEVLNASQLLHPDLLAQARPPGD